jgi:hypothetical protein
MSGLLTNALLRDIEEAQAKEMQAFFDAWAKEIQEETQREAFLVQEANQEAAKDEAIDRVVRTELERLRGIAEDGDTPVAISIPEGVRVAAPSIAAPSMASFAGLLSEIKSANATHEGQRSALWAISHGFLPHPSDLASILDAVPADRAWSQRFHQLGETIDRALIGHPKGWLGAEAMGRALDAMNETVRLLDRYGTRRTLLLAGNPSAIREAQRIGAPPAPKSYEPAMGRRRFDGLVRSLFS